MKPHHTASNPSQVCKKLRLGPQLSELLDALSIAVMPYGNPREGILYHIPWGADPWDKELVTIWILYSPLLRPLNVSV